MIRVWIDADGCPRSTQELLFRAVERRGIALTLVANRRLSPPRHPRISAVQVGAGLDVADDHLVQHATAGELVITSDLPLAAALVEKGVTALNPRGELWTAANVRERLSLRDWAMEARESGLIAGGGPPPMDEKAKRAFANALDAWISRAERAAPR
jgi:uncharacterized protein